MNEFILAMALLNGCLEADVVARDEEIVEACVRLVAPKPKWDALIISECVSYGHLSCELTSYFCGDYYRDEVRNRLRREFKSWDPADRLNLITGKNDKIDRGCQLAVGRTLRNINTSLADDIRSRAKILRILRGD